MESRVKRLAEVWTSDGRKLGLGQRLFHRADGVNTAQLLYGSYLEVENYEFGATYFVPTDFIDDTGTDESEIRLIISFRGIQERTWDRMPSFIARGEGMLESLPDG